MSFPIYCTAANDQMAQALLEALPEYNNAPTEVSLVWRQTPPPLLSRHRQTPSTGATWSARAGALATWPGLASVNVRDLGRVFAVGPIRNAFDGSATGDLMHLAPALLWAGIPAYKTRYYAGLIYLGGIFIIAKIPDQNAAELLEHSWNMRGARDISYQIADENLEPQPAA